MRNKIVNKMILLVLIVASCFMASCSSEDLEKDEVVSKPSINLIANIFYDRQADNDGKLKIWAEEVEIILENDLESILDHDLLGEIFQDGFLTISKEGTGRHYEFDNETLIYVEDGTSFDEDVFLAEITIQEDYLLEIREIARGEIKSQLYRKDYSDLVGNNGGHYLNYKGDIYYREYGFGSFEDLALWNEFLYDPYGISRIVRLSDGGQKEIMWEGYAVGGFFIYENMDNEILFIQDQFLGIEDQTADYARYLQTFISDLEGRVLLEYEGGSVYKIDQERRLAIIEGHRNSIDIMDLETGAVRNLTGDFCYPILYDPLEGMLYYEDFDERTINTININGGQLKQIFLYGSDYPLHYYELINPRLSGDFLWLYLAGYEGTDNSLQVYDLLKIDKNGLFYDIIKSTNDLDWFGIEKAFRPNESLDYYIYDFDNIMEARVVLKADELENLGHRNLEHFGDHESMNLENLEFVNGNLFFTVVEGIRDDSGDVGWRYAYRLKGAKTYRKNIKNEEIELIYEY